MLYEELRPRTFCDVIGQGDTPSIMRNQVAQDKIAHSYLLTGNRGSGKTTSARLIAKAANCLNNKGGEPCNECENCKRFDNNTFMDFKEIDAAKNNGVDNIRNIISDMQYGPQHGRYKVYIIDEVHMLSLGAVSAFLKTLEEPPKYAIFILCTTDPQKLPVTILSRCQRFDFKRIKLEDIVGRLRNAKLLLNLKIEDKALHLIAKLADGAMRDALSLLEQALSIDTGSGVSTEQVMSMLGVLSSEKILNIISYTNSKNTVEVLNTLNDLINDGKDPYIFLQDLIKSYRNLMIAKVNANSENLINASEEDILVYKAYATNVTIDTILNYIRILQDCERDFKYSSNQRTMLEMAFVKMTADTQENLLMKKIEALQLTISNMVSPSLPLASLEGNKDITDNLSDVDETPTEDKQLYEDEVMSKKMLDAAKDFVISSINNAMKTLNDTKKASYKLLVHSLVQSKLQLTNNILRIETLDEDNYAIIVTNHKTLENGFTKALAEKIDSDKVEIEIEIAL